MRKQLSWLVLLFLFVSLFLYVPVQAQLVEKETASITKICDISGGKVHTASFEGTLLQARTMTTSVYPGSFDLYEALSFSPNITRTSRLYDNKEASIVNSSEDYLCGDVIHNPESRFYLSTPVFPFYNYRNINNIANEMLNVQAPHSMSAVTSVNFVSINNNNEDDLFSATPMESSGYPALLSGSSLVTDPGKTIASSVPLFTNYNDDLFSGPGVPLSVNSSSIVINNNNKMMKKTNVGMVLGCMLVSTSDNLTTRDSNCYRTVL